MSEEIGPLSHPGSHHRRPNLLFFVVLVVCLAILVTLGSWQVRRLEWKQGLIETIEQRIAQSPVDLDAVLMHWQEAGDVEYYPIQLTGVFRHVDEQHFLATHQGRSGWHVYTPVQLSDGREVIANRGFVPYDMKEPSARPWTAIAGPMTFEGLSRNPLTEKPGWVVPDNASEDGIWYWKDFDAMAEAMNIEDENLVPFFVDLSADGSVGKDRPIAGVTRINLPNRHLQYAVTWFGLAVALVIVAGFVMWRGRRGSNS